VRSLRIVFLGNDPLSVPPLRTLAASAHDLVRVITAIAKPAGRGNRLTSTKVADAARELGLPLVEVGTVTSGSGLEALRSAGPDVLVVVAYGELLPTAVLDLPSVAPVNLHFSLLPAFRGAAPVQAALLHGLSETGVTTIRMDSGLDTGPILGRRAVPIALDDDAGSLGVRLAEVGGEVLVETVDDLASGRARPTPQRHQDATFAPKLGPDDRILRWGRPARELVNRCRAFAPEPGARTTFRGRDLRILRADVDDAGRGDPGRVVAVSRSGFVVGTGTAGFRPLELVPAGRRPMSGRDFVNGFRPRVGESLG
jgi:methionyl-tRNA formyltransferase